MAMMNRNSSYVFDMFDPNNFPDKDNESFCSLSVRMFPNFRMDLFDMDQ